MCSVFGFRWCGLCMWGVSKGHGPGSGRLCYVCVYCDRLIPASHRCTQCSMLLKLIDICF